MRRVVGVGSAILFFCAVAWAGGPKIESAKVDLQGNSRLYYFYVPSKAEGKPAPLLLLLHGSGRDGRIMVESWQKIADQEGIILVGLNAANPQAWNMKSDNPAVMRGVIDHVKTKYSVDPQRLYLFGHSAGAQFGLETAVLESNYFAATAVHAGGLWKEEYSILPMAGRKIPIALWSGTDDRLVPLDLVRATAAELKRQEFPVELNVMPRHDHNYYAVSDEVNRAAWLFLKDKRSEKPEFTEYQLPQ